MVISLAMESKRKGNPKRKCASLSYSTSGWRAARNSLGDNLQFLRQRGAFIEIRWQLHRAAQCIRERRLARATVLPVARHDAQLLHDHFRQRGMTRSRLLLGKCENVGIQVDCQYRAHCRNLPCSRPDGKRAEPRRFSLHDLRHFLIVVPGSGCYKSLGDMD